MAAICRLSSSVYSAALRGGCCVPPCVADVVPRGRCCTVLIARFDVNVSPNKQTLLLLLLLLLLFLVGGQYFAFSWTLMVKSQTRNEPPPLISKLSVLKQVKEKSRGEPPNPASPVMMVMMMRMIMMAAVCIELAEKHHALLQRLKRLSMDRDQLMWRLSQDGMPEQPLPPTLRNKFS